MRRVRLTLLAWPNLVMCLACRCRSCTCASQPWPGQTHDCLILAAALSARQKLGKQSIYKLFWHFAQV